MYERKDYQIGEEVLIDVFNRKAVIVDRRNKEVSFWFGYNQRGIIPFDELGFDVKRGVNEILCLFHLPFKTILMKKEKSKFDERVTLYYLSRRSYIEMKTNLIKIGEIYNGVISSIACWGIFVKICGGITVFIHCTEVSRSIIKELKMCFRVGDAIKVRIIEKKYEGGVCKIYGSRKQAGEEIFPSLGELLPVMITGEIWRNTYFCEVTPNQKGIIHVKDNELFEIGNKTYGYLTEYEKNGFCLRRF